MTEIFDKIHQLKAQITKHDEDYHRNDNPTISDAEYDELRKKLLEYQKDYPHFFSPDEEKVGAKSLDIFNKIKHSKPMLSLANGFSEEDIMDFIEKIERFLGFEKNNQQSSNLNLQIDLFSPNISNNLAEHNPVPVLCSNMVVATWSRYSFSALIFFYLLQFEKLVVHLVVQE